MPKAKETKENNKPDIQPSTMPSEYSLVTPANEGKRAWWKCEAGATVEGRLLGRFARRDANGAYYQIRLKKPAKAMQGKGDEAQVVTLGDGDIINVDERSAIKDLQKHADSDGVFDVFIRALEKVKLDGGRTFWRMEVGAKQLKAPTRPLAEFAQSTSTQQVDDQGIPF